MTFVLIWVLSFLLGLQAKTTVLLQGLCFFGGVSVVDFFGLVAAGFLSSKSGEFGFSLVVEVNAVIRFLATLFFFFGGCLSS